MKEYEIQGLDLYTDPAIREICSASNSTSSSTRSILYVLVIVNVLALMTVVNSWKYNWTDTRITNMADRIKRISQTKESVKNITKKDAMSDTLRADSALFPHYIRFDVENYRNIKIPILGNAFDVNNLGIIAGLTFVILLVILRFTLGRELINLKLALNSITHRYTDFANTDLFKTNCHPYPWPHAMPSINKVRRSHHYNFLSMNEVFNMPPLEISKNRIQQKFSGRALMYIFYFPSIIYLILVINDASTFTKAYCHAPTMTIASMSVSILFLILILLLSYKCTWLKRKIYEQYVHFKDNGYRHIKPVETAG